MTASAPIQNKPHWIKYGVGLLVALILIAYFSRNIILGQQVDTYPATLGELTQTVVASGRVMSPRRISIASETTGRVKSVPVLEGQTVTRGQMLIELMNLDEHASVAQADASRKQAEARLRQLQEVTLPSASQTLKQAKANAEQAKKQYERTRVLQAKGFFSQAQLDEAKRDYDVVVSQVSAARLQVQSNQPTGSDLAIAVTSVSQANASLELAQVRLSEDYIVAPTDGVLISRDVELGDIVQPARELMVLAAKGNTLILVQLDEKNLAKLALGQQAFASADAYPAQRFDAVVSYINPGVDATRGAVDIKLLVANPPAYLRQDMTVSVDIKTAHLPHALTIPNGAIHDASSDAPWVLVVRKNRAVHQTVRLGLRGDNRVEVLSGLKADEEVILTAVGTITAGIRVRPNVMHQP